MAENMGAVLEERTSHHGTICEIYSKLKVADCAEEFKLRVGWALDETCVRSDGEQWDFTGPIHAQDAEELLVETGPELLVGAPPHLPKDGEKPRRGAHDGEVRQHAKFAARQHAIQDEARTLFLHVQPRHAAAWNLPEIRAVARRRGVTIVYGDMCRFC